MTAPRTRLQGGRGAADVISHVATPPLPDVEPFHWALYAAAHVPDADEVRLELSLRAPPGVDGPEQTARERVLGELRRALGTLGVARPATEVFRPRAVPVPA